MLLDRVVTFWPVVSVVLHLVSIILALWSPCSNISSKVKGRRLGVFVAIKAGIAFAGCVLPVLQLYKYGFGLKNFYVVSDAAPFASIDGFGCVFVAFAHLVYTMVFVYSYKPFFIVLRFDSVQIFAVFSSLGLLVFTFICLSPDILTMLALYIFMLLIIYVLVTNNKDGKYDQQSGLLFLKQHLVPIIVLLVPSVFMLYITYSTFRFSLTGLPVASTSATFASLVFVAMIVSFASISMLAVS